MSHTSMEMNTGLEQKGVTARHIVAIVISALIFGAVIYITRFLPFKMGTVQMFYPAAVVAPLFGLWFGLWGSAGLIVGNTLSMFAVGLNPLLFPLALLGQFMMGFMPGVAFRKAELEGINDTVKLVILIVLGQLACTTLVALNLSQIQHVPSQVVWGTIWPWMQFSNTLMAAILSPILFVWFSGYMKKSGLLFKKFTG